MEEFQKCQSPTPILHSKWVTAEEKSLVTSEQKTYFPCLVSSSPFVPGRRESSILNPKSLWMTVFLSFTSCFPSPHPIFRTVQPSRRHFFRFRRQIWSLHARSPAETCILVIRASSIRPSAPRKKNPNVRTKEGNLKPSFVYFFTFFFLSWRTFPFRNGAAISHLSPFEMPSARKESVRATPRRMDLVGFVYLCSELWSWKKWLCRVGIAIFPKVRTELCGLRFFGRLFCLSAAGGDGGGADWTVYFSRL